MNLAKFEDLFQEFVRERNFKQAIAWVKHENGVLENLLAWVKSSDFRSQNYASWLLLHYFETFPEDLHGEVLEKVQALFLTTKHPSVLRNSAGMLSVLKKGELSGAVLERCVEVMTDTSALPAQVFQCLKLVEKQFVVKYPELKSELCAISQTFQLRGSPSFQSMYRKYTKLWCER